MFSLLALYPKLASKWFRFQPKLHRPIAACKQCNARNQLLINGLSETEVLVLHLPRSGLIRTWALEPSPCYDSVTDLPDRFEAIWKLQPKSGSKHLKTAEK